MIFLVFFIGFFGYSWSTLLWYRCFYPHRSIDALSPVCGIFSFLLKFGSPFNFCLLSGALQGKATKQLCPLFSPPYLPFPPLPFLVPCPPFLPLFLSSSVPWPSSKYKLMSKLPDLF